MYIYVKIKWFLLFDCLLICFSQTDTFVSWFFVYFVKIDVNPSLDERCSTWNTVVVGSGISADLFAHRNCQLFQRAWKRTECQTRRLVSTTGASTEWRRQGNRAITEQDSLSTGNPLISWSFVFRAPPKRDWRHWAIELATHLSNDWRKTFPVCRPSWKTWSSFAKISGRTSSASKSTIYGQITRLVHTSPLFISHPFQGIFVIQDNKFLLIANIADGNQYLDRVAIYLSMPSGQ